MAAAVAPAFVKIFVADFERSIAFYRDCFGFEEVQRFAAPGFDEVVIRPGAGKRGASLVLCRWQDGRALDLGNAHGPVGFFVADVDAAHAVALAAGATEKIAPTALGGNHISILRDPDGYEIELLQLPSRPAT